MDALVKKKTVQSLIIIIVTKITGKKINKNEKVNKAK